MISFKRFVEQTEVQSKDKNKSSSRFLGTNSLTNVYKKDTPGEQAKEVTGTKSAASVTS
jgi:hypothetical protein